MTMSAPSSAPRSSTTSWSSCSNLQIVQSIGPSLAGALLSAVALAINIISIIVGRPVSHTGLAGLFPILGMTVLTASYLVLTTVDTDIR